MTILCRESSSRVSLATSPNLNVPNLPDARALQLLLTLLLANRALLELVLLLMRPLLKVNLQLPGHVPPLLLLHNGERARTDSR